MNHDVLIPISTVLQVALQCSLVYWAILLGLKWVGRRALGQMGPHEFILISFLVKIMSDQIITEEAGLWGNFTGGATVLFHVWLIDHIPALKRWVQGTPISLMENNVLNEAALKCNNISHDDLTCLAHQHGHASYAIFKEVYMEKDGHLTGVINPDQIA